MKNTFHNIFLIALLGALMLCGITTNNLYAFNFKSSSILAQGKWVKIQVEESGICKLTYDNIKSMGFSSPSEIRIFGYGGAILNEKLTNNYADDLDEVPLYQGNDYFLFYAQGPIRNFNLTHNNHPRDFEINVYSKYGYYFITTDAGEKKRIDYRKFDIDTTLNTVDINNYIDQKTRKVEELNFLNSGKMWFGDKFGNNQSRTFRFDFDDVDSSQVANVYANLTAYSPMPSSLDISVSIGDTILENTLPVSLCPTEIMGRIKTVIFRQKPTNGRIAVTTKFNGKYESDFATIERIIVSAYRPLHLTSRAMTFRNPLAMAKDTNFLYHIGDCNENIQIWDISDYKKPTRVKGELNGSTFSFFDHCNKDTIHEFIAVDVKSPTFITAKLVGTVKNQNLHAEEPADLVIVAHPNFLDGAQRLAQLHEDYDNMTTLITTPEKIYNEFSSGTPDATAIRWFMKKLYDQNGQKPFYLLLIGDGCFDNRGLTASSSKTINNFVVVYEGGSAIDEVASYVADDYFTFVSDVPSPVGYSQEPSLISVGRIPCSTSSQLDGYINKVEKHLQNKNYGKWKNKVVLLADDNELSYSYNRFFGFSDNIASKVYSSNPAMNVKKVYFDAYTRTTGANGSRYYDVERIVKEEIEDGVMIFNYIGHSSKIGFSAEHVFTQTEAGSLYNQNCGFWFTASCNFAQFDDYTSSGGEDLILNPNGGAIAMISASRSVYDNLNDNLNQNLFKVIFYKDRSGNPLAFGDIMRLAKNAVADTNKLAFNLIGDPSLRLSYPTKRVLTDSIRATDGTPIDTLNALSEAVIYGHISDYDYNNINDFNGTLYITLYDKEVKLYTRGNIYTDEEERLNKRHSYYDRPNILFSGETEVVNGDFSIPIKIPKDINYNYGFGKITYYAYDDVNGYDAQGSVPMLRIGGSSDHYTDDEQGPAIALFMNSQSFKSGDKVNPSPVFIAKVSDENGINASGAGIGHDITLTLDGSTTPIVLNSYFSYDKNSFKSGIIRYQLNDLAEGSYTITFKVWDLLNNSSTKSIHFKVDNDAEIEIDDMIVYPNPVKDVLTINVLHDRPQTVQSFRFLLHDLSGELLYESDGIETKDNGQLNLTWDLTTSTGRRIRPGCYVGRIEAKTSEGDYVGESKKIIVLPQ